MSAPSAHRRRPPALLVRGMLPLALAGTLWAAAPLHAQDNSAPPEVGRQRTQIQQLGRERTLAEQSLKQITASEAELRLEIEGLAERVRESLRRKEALESRILRQRANNDEQGRELLRLQDEIRAGERRIGLRLLRLYRVAKQGRSARLFQMARFGSFAKDSRQLALLQDLDRAAIVEFEALNRQVLDKKKQVEDSLNRLVGLRAELSEETAQLAERQAYLRRAMGDVSRNRELYGKYLDEVETMMTRMEVAVTRMEQEAKAAAAAPPRPRKPSELRGTLPLPADGEVIAMFGAQDPRYDLKKRQRGIVLRVAQQAPVAAVAPGRAVHAGEFRGYQALVVLDHGEGLFTVYGHLEQIEIERGDWVPQGKLLGRATFQPVDEAYNVYFEVRHNGRPDDPLAWLKPGSLRVSPDAAGG